MSNLQDFDIDKPIYDMDTYIGRCKYFFTVVNPFNLLVSGKQLDRAKEIVRRQRAREPQDPSVKSVKDLIRAKVLYDSAFHPETGEKQVLAGRMSAQVPGNMILSTCMIFFYKSTAAVVFWQWVNQSFNALVNYTNRSGASTLTNAKILQCYISATTCALVVALSFKRLTAKAPPLLARFVPYMGVFSATFVNVPLMRSTELIDGTTIYDDNGKPIGQSKNAARLGILLVILSRNAMGVPNMLGVPALMDQLKKRGHTFKHQFVWELGLCGLALALTTPMCCAFFKQYRPYKFDKLEPNVQQDLMKKYNGNPPKVVYFNKGL